MGGEGSFFFRQAYARLDDIIRSDRDGCVSVLVWATYRERRIWKCGLENTCSYTLQDTWYSTVSAVPIDRIPSV